MAREIKVFSMSFLDLLCCSLGAVLLLSLLTIVSIRKDASATLEETYFLMDAVIWVDVEDMVKAEELKAGAPFRTAEGEPDYRKLNAVSWPNLPGRFFRLEIKHMPLEPSREELARLTSDADMPTILTGTFDRKVATFPFEQLEFRISPVEVENFVLAVPPWNPNPKVERWYYRMEVHAWGLEVPRGFYFFRASFPSKGYNDFLHETAQKPRAPGEVKLGAENVVMAYFDLQGSGVAGRTILQTHSSLPESPLQPLSEKQSASRQRIADGLAWPFDYKNGAGQKAINNYRRLRVPTVYAPHWNHAGQANYNVQAGQRQAFDQAREQWSTDRFLLTLETFSNSKEFAYHPVFCLETAHGASFAPESEFPLRRPKHPNNPKGDPRLGLHRVLKDEQSGVEADRYLPALCVTSGRP